MRRWEGLLKEQLSFLAVPPLEASLAGGGYIYMDDLRALEQVVSKGVPPLDCRGRVGEATSIPPRQGLCGLHCSWHYIGFSHWCRPISHKWEYKQ